MHIILISLIVLGTAIAGSRAQTSSERDWLLEDERNTISVFDRVSESVVFISTKQYQRDIFNLNVYEIPAGTGSGFIWDDRGHIVTNYHVIQPALARQGGSISVKLANGETYEAEIKGVEPNKDLAVLKIEAPRDRIRPVQVGNSDELVVGQKVLAVGNPFGLDQTLTTGVISALDREIRSVTQTRIQGVIQTDASINPGNSGGPLLDSRGFLIGVNTMIVSTSKSSAGVGFAVPANTVSLVVPQLIRDGRVTRAGLGVTVVQDRLSRRWGVQGVVVNQVTPGSGADRAGIQSLQASANGRVLGFDTIVRIGDLAIHNYADLYAALDGREPGEEVEVEIDRGGKRFVARVKLKKIQ